MCINLKNRNVGAGISIRRHQDYNGRPKDTNVEAAERRKTCCQESGMDLIYN